MKSDSAACSDLACSDSSANIGFPLNDASNAFGADLLALDDDPGGFAIPGVGGQSLGPELDLLDLRRRRARQGVDDADITRHHEMRHARTQKLDESRRIEGFALADSDHRANLVLGDLASHRDRGRFA